MDLFSITWNDEVIKNDQHGEKNHQGNSFNETYAFKLVVKNLISIRLIHFFFTIRISNIYWDGKISIKESLAILFDSLKHVFYKINKWSFLIDIQFNSHWAGYCKKNDVEVLIWNSILYYLTKGKLQSVSEMTWNDNETQDEKWIMFFFLKNYVFWRNFEMEEKNRILFPRVWFNSFWNF